MNIIDGATEKKSQDALLARLEALLFVHGEPLTFRKVEKMLGVAEGARAELISTLSAELAQEKRGLALLTTSDSAQLVTKPHFGDLLLSFVKEELSEALTPASLEVLSIIAYLGPISRVRLEHLRGVNSAFTLRNLRVRGLVERVPDPAVASSFIYDISADCMRHLGMTRREELPDYDKFHSLLGSIPNGGEDGGAQAGASGEAHSA